MTKTKSVSRGAGASLKAAFLAGTALIMLSPMLPVMVRQAAAQTSERAISVRPGPLTTALNNLAAQTGLQILFDASVAEAKTTRGVNGTLTPEQALRTVLAGTGVNARFAGSNQVTLQNGPAASGATADGTTQLEAITIYGARNASTLGATTSSVAIVNAETLAESQIRTTQDTYRRMANVLDSATVNAGFVIRGMSSEGLVPSGGPAGSVYVDGIVQTRYNARFGARNLWDVEQVEVYRGPQSTLSGRAAMTGAIYIKSKDPTFDKEVELSGTVGSDDLAGTAFMVNTPVVEDQIALRLSGAFERSHAQPNYSNFGIFDNFDDLTTDISGVLRAKVLITPSEMPDTRALLTYSYSKDRPNDALVGLDTLRGDFNNSPVTYTEYRWTEAHNVGLEITHDFSNALRFTSQTGYQYGINNRRSIDYGTPGTIYGSAGEDDNSIFTQEFRLNYEEDRWKWVAGLYGSREVWDGATTFIVDYPGYGPVQLSDTQNRKTSNFAIFGEATYEFAPTWFATAGGRLDYLKDRDDQRNYFGLIDPSAVLTGDPTSLSELNFVPKLALSKELSDTQTVALTYTQGFRSGGSYIDRLDPKNYKVATYDPEFSQNVELSYKGTLLDDRLTLNANVFYTKYDDQQIEIRPIATIPGYRITSNAATSRAWGFEIEPTFQVTDQFTAFTSIGYLNTRFLEFNHAAIGDQSGKAFPEAPELSWAFGGRYEFDNGVFVGADAKYTTSYNSRFGTKGMYNIDPRFIVNAQTGFKKDNWEVTAFVENLTDEQYFTIVDRDAAKPFGQLGKGRSYGLNVRVKF
ncbi:TonB-dependent receptor [Agrobacterium sp. MAFF310724]|uniref:TonB-dependent receptor domain-containing protein n=1 Tax=Agrobacterium TaxID=357 RepID=UPI001F43FD87|nr:MULTISPECIES: TonB-dependent receptor [Agrobacterium]MDA5241194.1 TonB-dependent receptor [Agrobacterium sp. MAFF310724]MDA5249465.1 TonB-dependent receptor [Agrobacterium sp. MAFF210268]